MGVQLQQTKAKQTGKKVNDHFTQSTSKLNAAERAAVDRYVEITQELKKHEAIITEADKLKKQLASIAADAERFPETDVATLRGEEGVVEFSAPKNTREITNKNGLIGKLKDIIGYEKLVETLTIPLGLADKYLSENELAPFITSAKGSRSLTSARVKDA